MRRNFRTIAVVWGLFFCCTSATVLAQDWPQWRGPNRDGKATGFQPPDSWPAELTQKWKVTVGEGVATPVLVGERLYVFSREGDNEIIRCLDAGTGDEIWKDQYATAEVSGAAGRFSSRSGPRSTPVVADGKVVTLGVQEILSCYDAATGMLLWRNEEFKEDGPQFYTSSSPIVVDGMCIAQLGGEVSGTGHLIAYDLATGDEKWRWSGEHPAYGSPVVMTVSGTKMLVAPINENMVAVDASSGKLLWKIPYSQGRYNAASPIVDDQKLVVAGPGSGITSLQIAKEGEELASEKAWGNLDNSVIYNTPVIRDGLLFGLSTGNQLFCINTETGQTAWTVTATGQPAAAQPQPQAGERRGGGGGRRGGRGGGNQGYGSIVDAGSAIFALPASGQLVIFEPSAEFKMLATYKVSDSETHAYPVVSGNRIYVKDQDSVTLWTIE